MPNPTTSHMSAHQRPPAAAPAHRPLAVSEETLRTPAPFVAGSAANASARRRPVRRPGSGRLTRRHDCPSSAAQAVGRKACRPNVLWHRHRCRLLSSQPSPPHPKPTHPTPTPRRQRRRHSLRPPSRPPPLPPASPPQRPKAHRPRRRKTRHRPLETAARGSHADLAGACDPLARRPHRAMTRPSTTMR